MSFADPGFPVRCVLVLLFRYTFSVDADDHVRLWVDGALLIDSWDSASSNTARERTINLEWTRFHDVILEWREIDGEAFVQLYYESYHNPRQVVRPERFFSTWELDGYPMDVQVCVRGQLQFCRCGVRFMKLASC